MRCGLSTLVIISNGATRKFMNNEDRYKECLLHVLMWVGGTDSLSHLQPMHGRNTHRIALIVNAVLDGMTVEQAVQSTESDK